MDKKPSIYNLTLPELEAWLAARGEPSYRANQTLKWLYDKRKYRFQEMSDLSEDLRRDLDHEFMLEPLCCARTTGSRDTTQKFLFALKEDTFIESVLIPPTPPLYASPSAPRPFSLSTQLSFP